MSCRTCGRSRNTDGYNQPMMLDFPPYNARDIVVIKNNEKKKLDINDWNEDAHKLLIFTENIEEIDAGNFDNISEYNIQPYVFSVYNDEPLEHPEIIRATSYILPTRLNLLANGNLKKSIVFVKNDGSTIIQDFYETMSFDIKSFIANIKTYIGGESANLTQE